MIPDLALGALIGVCVGFIGGYAGIAGAPLVVFLLTVVLGFSQHEAQGTVLAMMLGPMSLLATISSWHLIKPKLLPIIICIVAYATTSYVGGLVAYVFVSADLKRLFGFLLIAIGAAYATQFVERHIKKIAHLEMKPLYVGAVGVAVGFVGGMFGIGAGILLVPIFTAFFGLEQNTARAMSLAILLPPVSLGAVVKYGLIEADINWAMAGTLLVSFMVLNGLGSSLGNKENPVILKRILGVLLVLFGVLLIATVRGHG